MNAQSKNDQQRRELTDGRTKAGLAGADTVTDFDSCTDNYRAFLKFLPDPVYVVGLDKTVAYLNPAFENIFGWTLEELKGRRFPFVPGHLKDQTREIVQRLFREKVVHGFETQRLTKDGRILDVVVEGAVFYGPNGQPAGQVVTFRDVTRQKRLDRSNQALFRIAKALYQFRGLDERLDFITRQAQDLIGAEGAIVILVDDKKKEFFFRAAAYDDTEAEKKYKETRYPLDKGVAGAVYRSGQPIIVTDYYNSEFLVESIDRQIGFKTHNMVQVPIWTEERMIGTLCVINKREGMFDQDDVDLVSTIASIVALPIVNATINEQLESSYAEVKSLNRAKDRVIHHLSHELKTPVSVLDASLGLLEKRLGAAAGSGADRILDRAKRNLRRILEMQYQIEDMLQEKDYTSYRLLNRLLDACADALAVFAAGAAGQGDIIETVRRRIETVFGPKQSVAEQIRLDHATADIIRSLRPAFAHRHCRLITQIEAVAPIQIPGDVLEKIVEGLVRNAVENTPDGGRIVVKVTGENGCPELVVSDFGVGITPENRRLIFDNYFTSYETMQYTSRRPYDFGAGGRGFDLLRLKIFSERFNFKIRMKTKRCRFIPGGQDQCPGDIARCAHCRSDVDCIDSGGTMITISFSGAADGCTD